MMMISQKNHLVSKTKNGQQRKRLCFSNRSLIFFSVCATTVVHAATATEFTSAFARDVPVPPSRADVAKDDITHILSWDRREIKVKEVEPESFRHIRQEFLRSELYEEFRNETGVVTEDDLLRYVTHELLAEKKARNSAGSGSKLRFSGNKSLLLKNLVAGDEEIIREEFGRHYSAHATKYPGESGMTDYLYIFERSPGHKTDQNYFVVMANVFYPGQNAISHNEIVDKYFGELPWVVVDVKGSCVDRYYSAKENGSEFKELDLLSIIGKRSGQPVQLLIKENEINREFLGETFRALYNGLKFNHSLKVSDASFMLQIALFPSCFDTEHDSDETSGGVSQEIERALITKRTIIGYGANGKILIRPTRILDNFQKIESEPAKIIAGNAAKNTRLMLRGTWEDRKYMEHSTVRYDKYFHRACAFFDHYFKIERDGEENPIGSLSLYVANENRIHDKSGGTSFIAHYEQNFNPRYTTKSPELEMKAANTYTTKITKKMAYSAKYKKMKDCVTISYTAWFWFIKQRVMMLPSKLLRDVFGADFGFTRVCYEICRDGLHGNMTGKLSPKDIADQLCGAPGHITETCARLLDNFLKYPNVRSNKKYIKIREKCDEMLVAVRHVCVDNMIRKRGSMSTDDIKSIKKDSVRRLLKKEYPIFKIFCKDDDFIRFCYEVCRYKLLDPEKDVTQNEEEVKKMLEPGCFVAVCSRILDLVPKIPDQDIEKMHEILERLTTILCINERIDTDESLPKCFRTPGGFVRLCYEVCSLAKKGEFGHKVLPLASIKRQLKDRSNYVAKCKAMLINFGKFLQNAENKDCELLTRLEKLLESVKAPALTQRIAASEAPRPPMGLGSVVPKGSHEVDEPAHSPSSDGGGR